MRSKDYMEYLIHTLIYTLVVSLIISPMIKEVDFSIVFVISFAVLTLFYILNHISKPEYKKKLHYYARKRK